MRNMVEDKESFFRREVASKFEFLNKQFAFHTTFPSDRKVRYHSSKIYVEVFYSRLGGEIGIEFGRLKNSECFSFTLFLRSVNPVLAKSMGEMLTSTNPEIQSCVMKLADALHSEGPAILLGEDTVFERMQDVRWWDFQPDALI